MTLVLHGGMSVPIHLSSSVIRVKNAESLGRARMHGVSAQAQCAFHCPADEETQSRAPRYHPAADRIAVLGDKKAEEEITKQEAST